MQTRPLPLKRYGPTGRTVAVLHGGPGAQGGATLLARALADPLHVLEPWQRVSSGVPLSVAQHIEDLEAGCGTFDRRSRARLRSTLEERTPAELRDQLSALTETFPDAGERAARAHALSDPLYTYSRAVDDPPLRLDLEGHQESWSDMVRLQEAGVYPAAFTSITCPVLMLHGSYDPHPGDSIRDSLRESIPHLEYIELDRCGHAPWVEEHARDRFLSILRSWLQQRLR
jgi:pimeloyl-ACP methyl ester carboxylesterase